MEMNLPDLLVQQVGLVGGSCQYQIFASQPHLYVSVALERNKNNERATTSKQYRCMLFKVVLRFKWGILFLPGRKLLPLQ